MILEICKLKDIAKQLDEKIQFSFISFSFSSRKKKIQGNLFLLNQRPHAKIQLIWTTFSKNGQNRHLR